MGTGSFFTNALRILSFSSIWLIATDSALSQEARVIENGIVAFEGGTVRVEDGTHGTLCSDSAHSIAICTEDMRIEVTGNENCVDNSGEQFACTRYGYTLDYTGAAPGDTLECRATQSDGFNDRSKDYSVTLDTASGTITRGEWFPLISVDRRLLISEVHQCSYQGQMLASIEFMVNIEPNGGSAGASGVASVGTPTGPAPGVAEPYFAELPQSCDDLTEIMAASLLEVDSVQGSASSEHVANLSSTCTYTSSTAPFKTVFYLYKYMPYGMFDQNTLEKTQLVFNASMVAGGGERPYKVIEDLGKFTFLFETENRSTVLVVTGMQGPVSGGNEPTEFIAAYYIEDANRPHAVRLRVIEEIARQNFAKWVPLAQLP